MKPKILYSYDEWIIKQKERISHGLSSEIESIHEDTANRLFLSIKAFNSKLTDEEKSWCEWYDHKSKLAHIESEYTAKMHAITQLIGSLEGKNHKARTPIYTKIGKIQCQIIKLEEEYDRSLGSN